MCHEPKEEMKEKHSKNLSWDMNMTQTIKNVYDKEERGKVYVSLFEYCSWLE
jgi:hypothetical protein